jgi:hypothetical protein
MWHCPECFGACCLSLLRHVAKADALLVRLSSTATYSPPHLTAPAGVVSLFSHPYRRHGASDAGADLGAAAGLLQPAV